MANSEPRVVRRRWIGLAIRPPLGVLLESLTIHIALGTSIFPFTLGRAGIERLAVTDETGPGPGRSGPSRAPPPSGIQLTGPSVGLSGGRRLLTLSLIFRADGVRAGTLSVVRTSSAPAVDVSNDSSIQCWKCARDWRRASVIDTDEDVFNSPLYWRQQSSVDIDYSVTRMR